MPPTPTHIVFEPHVAAAIVCLVLALVATLVALALALTDDREPRK
jgi:hypothetical protein